MLTIKSERMKLSPSERWYTMKKITRKKEKKKSEERYQKKGKVVISRENSALTPRARDGTTAVIPTQWSQEIRKKFVCTHCSRHLHRGWIVEMRQSLQIAILRKSLTSV